MTKLTETHHAHGAAGAASHAHLKKQAKQKKEKKVEDEEEEGEWEDEDEDALEGTPIVFDLNALKQQIDRLVAQQGIDTNTNTMVRPFRDEVITIILTLKW